MAAAIAPRKPQKRDDVESRTPLRIREHVAAFRWWLHVHPKWNGAFRAAPVLLVVEHYETTFPIVKAVAVAAWKVVA